MINILQKNENFRSRGSSREKIHIIWTIIRSGREKRVVYEWTPGETKALSSL